jgi:hypothetical protein
MNKYLTYTLLALVAIAAFMYISRTNYGHRGAGDTVHALASAFGIKQMENCGCKQRQENWNQMLPY